MELSGAQITVLLTLVKHECPVHIVDYSWHTWRETAFYGRPGPRDLKPRPSTIASLCEKGLLFNTTPKTERLSWRGGKYVFTKEGKALAQKLKKEAT